MRFVFLPMYFFSRFFPSGNQGERISIALSFLFYEELILNIFYKISCYFCFDVNLLSNLVFKLLILFPLPLLFYDSFDCIIHVLEELDIIIKSKTVRIIGGIIMCTLFIAEFWCIMQIPKVFLCGHIEYPLFSKILQLFFS